MFCPSFRGKRYLTQGVIATLDPVVQYGIWNYIDQFVNENPFRIDYLQIFRLMTVDRRGHLYLIIHHEQEVPEMVCEEALVFPTREVVDEKIYVISDIDEEGVEYSTMLLACEY